VTHSWSRAFGRVTSRINPQGLANSWLYDEFGRVRTETRSPGNTQFSYSACGPCFVASARYAVRETRSDGFWTETHHDSFGRVVGRSFVLADGRISRQVIEYDAAGRVGREALPYLDGSDNVYWTTYAYDALGRPRSIDRPVSETEPSGATQSFTYAGLDMTARDAELRTSVFTSDAEGRLISVRSAKNTTTAYAYTPFGQLSAIVDSALHRREMRYEERGLLAEVTDPDAGQRTFTYNAFGELVGQADGMTPPSTTAWEYDQLGRVTRRAEAEGVTVWSYSATPGPGRGLLVQVAAPGENGPTSFQESYAYDSKSRLQRVTTSIDGSAYQMDYGYGPENKIRTVTYPSTVGWRPRFIFGYSNGHLSLIAQDNAGITPLYTLLEMDASGRDTHASLGYDYFREVARYDQATGRLAAIHSGTVSSPALFQNYAYAWDRVGNLLQRQDAGVSPARTETFTYDSLDRLSQVALDGVTTLTMSYTADGNLRMKSDVGGMAYGMDGAGPHALTAVGGGPAGIMGFAYDANGNMTSRNGSAITWTSFNQPRQVNSGADFARFRYGPGRNRIRQDLKIGGTTKTVHYVNPYFEVEIQGGTRRFRSNVFAYGRAIYSQVESTAGGPENYYVLHDHLGSVDRLLRSAGSGSDAVAFSFDAWGKRRNTNWTADPAGARYADAHWTRRGYTGHEHLDNTRLVNMNGRLQDPFLGRMLSPDPVVGSLSSPQTLNPYSYVSNRPLSYFDPSGYFLSKLRKGLKRAIRHLGSTGRRVVRRWGRQIAAAVAAYYTAGAVSSWAYSAQAGGLAAGGVAAEGMASSTLGAAYASSSVLGGLAGGAVAGAIGSGDLRGMLTGAVTGAAMGGIAAHFGGAYSASRVIAEGTVGGLSAELQGGSFDRGFMISAGFSSLTWASLEMREAMIEQSRLNPRNASGISDGFRGDGFKLGGSRWPSQGSPLGGMQGGPGRFFNIDYSPGSLLDTLVEAYAGPHDFLNSPVFYTPQGLAANRWAGLELLNAANVILATPFAAAAATPSFAYGAFDD